MREDPELQTSQRMGWTTACSRGTLHWPRSTQSHATRVTRNWGILWGISARLEQQLIHVSVGICRIARAAGSARAHGNSDFPARAVVANWRGKRSVALTASSKGRALGGRWSRCEDIRKDAERFRNRRRMAKLWGRGRFDFARNMKPDNDPCAGATLFGTCVGWPMDFRLGYDARLMSGSALLTHFSQEA
jgi:hypothetical protein